MDCPRCGVTDLPYETDCRRWESSARDHREWLKRNRLVNAITGAVVIVMAVIVSSQPSSLA